MSIPAENLDRAVAMAGPKWLKTYLRQELPRLGTTEEDWLSWDERFKDALCARELEQPKQQKNYVAQARKAIKVLTGNEHHPALAFVMLPAELYVKINREAQGSLDARVTKLLDDPQALVDKAESLLESPDWVEVAAGLSVVTGRRVSETLSTAEFELASPWSVWFSGQLKRGGEDQAVRFEVPTLVGAASVIAALDRLRDLLPEAAGLSARSINNRYSARVARACDRHFLPLVPAREGNENLYTHLLRGVYATIAAFWFCPPQIPPLEFRAYIQGHFGVLDADNPQLQVEIGSQRNYSDYAISDGSGGVDGRLGIRLDEPDVTVLQYFQDRIDLVAAKPAKGPKPPKVRPFLLASQKERLEALGGRWGREGLIPALDAVLDWAEVLDDWAQAEGLALTADLVRDLLATAAPAGAEAGEEKKKEKKEDEAWLARAADFLQVEPQPDSVLAALAGLVQHPPAAPTPPQPQPAAPAFDDRLLTGITAQLTSVLGAVKTLGDRLDNVASNQEQQGVAVNQLQAWVRQHGKGVEAMSLLSQAFGANGAAGPVATPAPAPPPATTPVAVTAVPPQPPPTATPPMSASIPSAADTGPLPAPVPFPADDLFSVSPGEILERAGVSYNKKTHSYVATALQSIQALIAYNQSANREHLVFISGTLLRELTPVNRKASDATFALLQDSLDSYHDDLDIDRYQNRNVKLQTLRSWLQQHYPHLPLR